MRTPLHPTTRSCLMLLFILGLWGGWEQGRAASPVSVQARLSETDIYLGESTTLEVRIHGIRNPDLPELSHPDMEISKGGGQNFNNSSYTIINGQARQSEEFGYVARYTLRPRVAGTLQVPPCSVTHDGQTYRSNALTIIVRQPPPQDTMLVEMHTNKPSYILGEMVTLTLNVSIRKLTINGTVLETDPFFREQPPHLQIPWFESLGEWKTSEVRTFAQPFLGQPSPGFYINDYRREGIFQNQPLVFTLPRQSSSRAPGGSTVAYFTYQLQKQFRPIRPGSQDIPPVLVKANLPIQVDARGRATRMDKIVASSTPLTVHIHPVPRAGQPSSFYGAVGQFRLEVEANPKVLRVGDPLSLSLTLRGDGLLDTVHPPALEQQAKLAEGFKIQADPPAVKTENEAKTFTYTLRPRRTGLRELPPIEVAYYDPEAQRFQIVRSEPIPLRVDAASTLGLSEVIDPTGDVPKTIIGQELTEGILANYSGEEVLVYQPLQLRLGWWTGFVLLCPPVTYLLLCGWRFYKRRQQRQPGYQRARYAAQRALRTLQSLQNGQGHGDIADGIHQAVTGYISDKLSIAGAGLTVDDVTRHLQARQLEPTLVEHAETLLQRCDSARYAPGGLVVAQHTNLIAAAETLVQRLEASGRL
ncbi:MAG: BatD family protein [Candidatus Tectimicrobiota bacterium]